MQILTDVRFFFSKSKVFFYYDPIVTIYNEDDKYTIEVYDDCDNFFSLDTLIKNNYTALLYAHRNDYIINLDCIRLDDCKVDQLSKIISMKTSRAKCYDHLATNFAMDYKMEKGITLRSIYEYSDILTPLCDSKMANVLGINALVFLNDGTLLMPLRGKEATISRNMVTSSIAVGCFWENKDETDKLEEKDFLRDFVMQGLTERLFLPDFRLKNMKINIHFLGLGRDVYWGGKPQIYYWVTLDLSAKEYLIFSQKDNLKKAFDKDSEILLVHSFKVMNASGDLQLQCIKKLKILEKNCYKYYYKNVRAESSFFNNCYHLSKYKTRKQEVNWLKNIIMS